MKYDLDYIKNLYVIVEEWDTDEEDSFYTHHYKIGDEFSEQQINDVLSSLDDGLDIEYVITELVDNSLTGELKSIYIKDDTGVVIQEWGELSDMAKMLID